MNSSYLTSRGYTLRFKAIPVLLQKMSRQFPMPPAPTYEVKTATGATEVHPHNETTLETDEDRAAWAKYQNETQTVGAAMLQAQLRVCLMEGVEVIARPAFDWEKRQRMLGFEIPTDADEKELHFLETEIAASAEDTLEIVAGVARVSGVDEEVVSTLENTFRRAMGQARAVDAAGGNVEASPEFIKRSEAPDLAREFAV